MFSLENLKIWNKPERIIVTQHGRKRLEERNIKIEDICKVIEDGKIIEQYEDDYPFPSCLILGKSNNRNLHLVVSVDEGLIYLITAYEPDPLKWESDLKTRKEKTK